MYHATRKFIAARQPFCELPLRPTKVKQVGGGIENRCYDNAYEAKKAKANIVMVSGWVVTPYDPVTRSAQMVAHWWNWTDGQHWDTTPFIKAGFEYVIDGDLYQYARDNDAQLGTHIASSILFKDDLFFNYHFAQC